jgi:hypothetical protein
VPLLEERIRVCLQLRLVPRPSEQERKASIEDSSAVTNASIVREPILSMNRDDVRVRRRNP